MSDEEILLRAELLNEKIKILELQKRIAELEEAMENFRAEAQLPWHYFRAVLDKPDGGADE